MKNKLKWVAIFSMMAFFAVASIKTEAVSFTKKIIHPENQLTDTEPLNLLMKPGQKQTVKVEVTNYSDKEDVIQIKVNGARTNGSGGLEYGPSKFKKDKTMKYDLPDLLKAPKEIKVPAKGTADMELEIEMPDVAFDGIVTGGIEMMSKSEVVEEKKDDGSMVANKFAFVFGVTLRMDEKEVKPDFELRKVSPGLSNYRTAIISEIANTQGFLAKDMTLNVDITKKGKEDVLYNRKKSDLSMAPNTLMLFDTSLNGEPMVAGDYTAHVVLKGYDDEWKWTKDFKITKEQADKFNKDDVYLVQERGLNWKLIALIVAGILVVVIIIVVVSKKAQKKKKSKKK